MWETVLSEVALLPNPPRVPGLIWWQIGTNRQGVDEDYDEEVAIHIDPA